MADPPRLPLVDGDDGTWGDILNEFLEVSHNNPDGTLKSSAVSGAGAEMTANKDTDGTLAANSDTKYPSQKAVKTYVDTADGNNVKLTGDQTITGTKTFTPGMFASSGANGKAQMVGFGGGMLQAFKNSTDSSAAIRMWAQSSSGAQVSFGPGGTTEPDTTITRTAANELTTNANIVVNNGASAGEVTVTGSGGGGISFKASPSDSQPALQIGYGGGAAGMLFGPGGSTSPDTYMVYDGTGELRFSDVRLKDVTNPIDAQDAATKNYVDTQDALSEKIANKGVANGYAPLDSNALLPYVNMPLEVNRYQSILQGYWDKLAANTAVTLFLGDSITWGAIVPQDLSYPEQYQKVINRRYGGTYTNWTSPATANSATYGDSTRNIAYTGTPTVTAKGLGSGAMGYLKAGDSNTFTSNRACTVIGFWYQKGPSCGNVKITVDGGTPVTIDSGAATQSWGNIWTSGTLTSGIHTIKVEGATGGAYNAGYAAYVEAFTFDPSGLPRVINASRQGAQTAHFIQANNPNWQDGLKTVAPSAAVIFLGTNDVTVGITQAQTKANLQEMITTLNALPSPPSVIAVATMPENSGITHAQYLSRRQDIYDLATANANVLVWDLGENMGANTNPNYGAVFGAGVHPNVFGNQYMADQLGQLLLPPSTQTFRTLPAGIAGQLDWDNTATNDVFGSLMLAPSGFATKFARIKTGGANGTTGTVFGSASLGGLAIPSYTTLGARNVTVWSGLDMAWDSQPTATTELFGGTKQRFYCDTSMASQVRVTAHIVDAGGTGATLALQYSTDGTTWAYPGASSTPSMAITSANSDASSSWVDLIAAAKADLRWRIVGSCTASGSPSFSSINVEFR